MEGSSHWPHILRIVYHVFYFQNVPKMFQNVLLDWAIRRSGEKESDNNTFVLSAIRTHC
jgi:hypothetical protein